MATPLELIIAIHYHCFSSDYGSGSGEHFRSEAVQGILSDFISKGLLERTVPRDGMCGVRKYKGTEALTVWVDALCAVPYPIKLWVIPND